MGCAGTSNCDCGCCAGTSVRTPQAESNLPGLPAISYRTGVWSSFKESMLARLSSSNYPALGALRTRSDDDFTIALLDASAVVLDILTFYQERLANESYLRTACQPRSLTELSRLIGYQPAPGVSASTYLAFTLNATPGAPPDPAAPAITIPAGSQVQSVPAQGQTPQVFETSADIQAKAAWTALQVQLGTAWQPNNSSGVYLSGTTTQLQPGDSLLILGVKREGWTAADPPSEQWDVVVLNQVVIDSARKLTYVAWDSALDHSTNYPAITTSCFGPATPFKIFAFRQKAALFGHNAPDPSLFVTRPQPTPAKPNPAPVPTFPSLINPKTDPWSWRKFNIPSNTRIDLDATYTKAVAGGWYALTIAGRAQLYRIASVTAVSLASFGLSGKVTELQPDYRDPLIGHFTLRETEVWIQSDQLTVAEQPLNYPLFGPVISLETLRTDMVGVQVVAISGKRQKLAVATGVTNRVFTPYNGKNPTNLKPGDILTLTSPPAALSADTKFAIPSGGFTGTLTLNVEDANGRLGTVVNAALSDFVLAPSIASDPVVGECAQVTTVDSASDPAHTRLTLPNLLTYCYERATATVNANVAAATHGQSVTEIMGSGSAAQTDQTFTLKQSPLTYVAASTIGGRQSTLLVRANGIEWSEEPSLYNQAPAAQVYATLYQSDATTDVLFGDGVEGATLPTGQNNVQASYRIGLGIAGNVGAGSLSTLMDRPLGVSGVTNPGQAAGGQDPESINDIRSNAPTTVLTLGRAVSVTDYENIAATYAGIAKAYAIWIPSGPKRGIFVTVAAAGGVALQAPNATLTALVNALQSYGNPLVTINAASFVETLVGFTARIKYDPAYEQPAVTAQVMQTLGQTFGFAQRTFGQGVSSDQLAAVIQSVPGVVAVNVSGLKTTGSSYAGDLAALIATAGATALTTWNAQPVTPKITRQNSGPSRICPYLPVPNPKAQSLPQPAEILVLDPDPANVTLGLLP